MQCFFVDIFGFPSRDVFHFVASLRVCNFCAFSIAYQSKLCKGTSFCFMHCGFAGNIAFGVFGCQEWKPPYVEYTYIKPAEGYKEDTDFGKELKILRFLSSRITIKKIVFEPV